jgi:dethiobiotin synthetase
MKGLFITGTDTGVGKTIAAAALARLLHNRGVNVGVLKPVTSGCREVNGRLVSQDAELLAWGAGLEAVDDYTAPYLLREAIAPSEAAEREGVVIEFRRIGDAFSRLASRHDFIIVEGAGGLMAPLAGSLLVADLVNYLSLPILVVARPALGTINHTVLTCLAAKHYGITLSGVIINNYPEFPDSAEESAPHLISSLTGVLVLAVFPHINGINQKEVVTGLASRISREPGADKLLREIGIA